MTQPLLICGVLLISIATAFTHHSIAGYYDSSREVTVEGVVSQFRFVQPHPFVVVDVRRGGATEQWELEMDNRGELIDIGFTETTLKPGDRLVVSGSPARRERQRIYVRRLDRPADGFSYEQVGTRPRLRKSAR
jgi:hypothetical protein